MTDLTPADIDAIVDNCRGYWRDRIDPADADWYCDLRRDRLEARADTNRDDYWFQQRYDDAVFAAESRREAHDPTDTELGGLPAAWAQSRQDTTANPSRRDEFA